jgi:hypothetical protein
VLSESAVDHIGQRGALLGAAQPGPARVLGEHGSLLQHRPGVAQHAIDRHVGDARDIVGALAGPDPCLDVTGGQRVGGVVGHRGDGDGVRTGGPVRMGRRSDPVVDGQREETADLVREDESLTVFGEGDEPDRTHR